MTSETGAGRSYRAPEAARAIPEERPRFVRRTYGHLAGAVLALVAAVYALLQVPGVGRLAGLMTTGWNWLVVLVLFAGASYVANRWARRGGSRGAQYVGLGLYVVAQALIFVPLLYTAAYLVDDPTLIPTAGVIACALFLGLTAVAFTTRADFSFLRGLLVVGSLVALGLIVASIVFGFTLGLIFSVAMVGLAGASILYSTSAVLRDYRTDQYVAASLALFAAVATLFYNVLRSLMRLRQ